MAAPLRAIVSPTELLVSPIPSVDRPVVSVAGALLDIAVSIGRSEDYDGFAFGIVSDG
jgi:hypothetical protein